MGSPVASSDSEQDRRFVIEFDPDKAYGNKRFDPIVLPDDNEDDEMVDDCYENWVEGSEKRPCSANKVDPNESKYRQILSELDPDSKQGLQWHM